VFLIELSKGDFIQGLLSYNTERTNSGISVYSRTDSREPYASDLSLTAENEWTYASSPRIENEKPENGPAEFRLYNEGPDDMVCVALATPFDDSTPWELSFELDESEPPELVSPSELSELESQMEQKNQRISELESLLEQKNLTISELESRVEELESQASTTSGDGNITIDVMVNPANGQENFVEGGEAVVQAESENADVSEMQVEYGSGTYQLDSSGEAAIPLAQTGTQEITLVYGDITEQVSFDVQTQDGQGDQQNQEDQQNQQETAESEESGPGFGIITAVITTFVFALLIGRYMKK